MRNRSAEIEAQLAAALAGEQTTYDNHSAPADDCNAAELYQRAYDQAMAEYEALQAQLRELERDYANRAKRLKIEAARKLALAREIAAQAPVHGTPQFR